MANSVSRLTLFRIGIPLIGVLAGILLLALLPIGMADGVRAPLYDQIFLAHCIVLLIAVFLALVFFGRLLSGSSFHIIPGWLILLGFLGSIFIETRLPVTARDALIHHLAVPVWWIKDGVIGPILWHQWSYYPMLINLAYPPLLARGLENLTALYHGLYLVLTAAVIAGFLFHRTKSHDLGLAGFFLTVTMPVCLKLAGTPLVDLGLAFYCAVALAAMVYWVEGEKWVCLLSGLALGLALGCKYNALLAAFWFFPCLLLYCLRAKVDFVRTVGGILGCGLCTFIVFLPWMLKNAYWIGNPFYPELTNYFGPFDANSIELPGLSSFSARLLLYRESWLDILLTPVRMILWGEDNNPRRFDGVLSPILLLLFLGMLKRFFKPWVFFLALLSACYFISATFLSAPRTRYYLPLLLPVITLAVIGFYDLGRWVKGREKKVIVALLCAHLSFAGVYAYRQLEASEAFAFVFSTQSREEYLRRRISEYPMIERVNSLPPESKVFLLLTGNRFYYYKVPVLSGGHNSAHPILKLLKQTGSLKFLRQEFRHQGITHIVAHVPRTLEVLSTSLSEQEKELWNIFQSTYLKVVTQEGQLVLWEVLPEVVP